MTRRRTVLACLLLAAGIVAYLWPANEGDAVRTTTLGGLGGGTEVTVLESELPELADLALRATVVHIGEVRINTPDQKLPTSLGRGGIDHLLPYSVVRLLVEEPLGARVGAPFDGSSSGKTIEVVVLGGTWTTNIPLEQALARGYEPDESGGEQSDDVDWSVSVAASTELRLHEELVIFLREHAMPVVGRNGETLGHQSVLISAAGSQGVFHRVSAGWQVRPTKHVVEEREIRSLAEIRELAGQLSKLEGPAREPGEGDGA